ncbi:MAG: PAS domain S-box protein [Arcobacteraceae bacterium]|nr:PAS domain S-box protein [Arcobacteraceae bacterium]
MNKIKNIEYYIVSLVALLFALVLYGEYNLKIDMYHKEKIEDLNSEYNTQLKFTKVLSETLFGDVLENETVLKIIDDANRDIHKDINREKLYQLFKEKYKRMEERGILQFHFHLKNGESFLRFHKPSQYGDNLLFRKSITKVIRTQKFVYGFEAGRYFEGFRYVYPLFLKNKYVGSVESSMKVQTVVGYMKENLEADYSIILNKNMMDKVVDKNYISKSFQISPLDKNYYQYIQDKKETDTAILEKIKMQALQYLKREHSFVLSVKDKNGDRNVFTFVAIQDIDNNEAGYIYSQKIDNSVNEIVFLQIVKFIIAFGILLILWYYYKVFKAKNNTIEQLKETIDKTTLVSKTDLSGRITYVNQAFCDISGYTENELLGKTHNIIRDPKVSKEVFKEMWGTIKNKKVWHGTISNRKKDGSIYIVDATIIPLLNTNNNIQEYIAIRHDITELESYKEILKEQLDDKSKTLEENIYYTKQYEGAMDDSVAILKTDHQNIINYVNKQFCELSGYSAIELIGTSCRNFRDKSHHEAGDCDRLIEQMSNKEIISMVFKNIAKNGEPFYMKTKIFPILNINGEVCEHLHLMNDISEIVNFNQELTIKINEAVEENSKKEQQIFEQAKIISLGDMIGNIAHQWRQPLSAITSTASAIKLHNELGILDNTEIDDKMEMILNKATYLSNTIDTFRNFIKEDKELKVVLIQNIIQDALKIVEASLYNYHIDIIKNIDDLNPIKVRIFKGELEQVIINIINNAKDILVEKKIDQKWIKIDLFLKEENVVVVTIEDNGGGIPEDIGQKIFEPYFTTKHQSQGTGLGLHMSKKIVNDSLKGNLYVKNTNDGAKFFIELPFNKVD